TSSQRLRVSAGVGILLTGQRHVVGHMGAIRIMRGVRGTRMSAPGSFSDMSRFSRRDAENSLCCFIVTASQRLRVSAGVGILLTGQRYVVGHMGAIRIMRGVRGSEDECAEFVFGHGSVFPQRRRGAETSLCCFRVTSSQRLRVSAGVRILLTRQRHVVGHMGAIRVMRGVRGARMSAPGSFSDMSQFSRRDAETQRILCVVSWSQHLSVSASLREFEFC
ncbi:MAG: hypothetical protein RLZZ458_413, partial [Planctomycetota bacterium]